MTIVRALSLWVAVLLLGGAGNAFAQRLDPVRPPAVAQAPQEQDTAEEVPDAEADPAAEAEAEPDPEPEPDLPPRARPTPPPPPQISRPPMIRRVDPQPPSVNAPVRAARPAAPAAQPPRPGASAPRAVAAAPAATDGIPPLDELIVTRERPLFSSTRRPPPPVEEPEVETPITEAKSMSFELVGVVRSDERAFAILRNTESKEETRVPKGEKFGAWTIEEVHDRSVVLAGEAKRIRMRLFDESKSPGISIQRVGIVDEPGDASAVDAGEVDEDVAPSASPEGRPATAQPVQRRVKGDNSATPAQRRKARLQQRRQQQRNTDE